MKVFCWSDTHGQVPQKAEADLYLHAGDFYNHGRSKRLRPLKDWAREMDDQPFWAVRGNHDCADPAGIFQGRDLSGSIRPVADGLWVVGIGWAGRKGCTPNEALMKQMCYNLLVQCVSELPDGAHTVLLSHYCATSRLGEAEPGFVYDSISAVVEALQPLAVIMGHCHRWFGRQWEEDGTIFTIPGPKGVHFQI